MTEPSICGEVPVDGAWLHTNLCSLLPTDVQEWPDRDLAEEQQLTIILLIV
jgi:hypothetical protein